MKDASNLPFHPTTGCLSPHQLVEVDAGSPADEAGLKNGDFILEVSFCSSFLLKLSMWNLPIHYCDLV